MGKQLLFCVEADKRSGTDWVYIKDTIDRFYKLTPDVSVKPIFLGGKTNYQRDKVRKQIREKANAYRKNGDTYVIYCIDTDELSNDPDRVREFDTIKAYCENNDYSFIWFCRDIEEVYWGKKVEQSEKTEYAKRFRSRKEIDKIPKESLMCKQQVLSKSNIVYVLDRLLDRQ